MLRTSVIFFAIGLPSIGFAQCPTNADLAQGITLTFDNGVVETFYTSRDNIIVNEGADNVAIDGTEWIVQLYQGVFEYDIFERTIGLWHPSNVFSLDYDFDVEAAFPLQIGDVGGGKQTLVDGGFSEPAIYSYSVHDGGTITIDGCDYIALDLYQTYAIKDYGIGLVNSVYLPELGFAFGRATSWPDFDEPTRTPIAISVDG